MPVAPRLYQRAKVQPYYKQKSTYQEIFAKPEPLDKEWGVSDQHAYWASQASYGGKLTFDNQNEPYHMKLLGAGYKLESTASDHFRVYHNNQGAILAFRGTQLSAQDLVDDAALAFGDYNSAGFVEARKAAHLAVRAHKNVHFVGHSLGGTKALKVSEEYGARATVFNPGSSIFYTFSGGQKVYTSEGDFIAKRVAGTNITRVPGSEHSLDQYEPLFE